MTHDPRILEPQCEWTVGRRRRRERRGPSSSTDAELAELDAALRHALAKSDDVLELGRDDFPLPTLARPARGASRTS